MRDILAEIVIGIVSVAITVGIVFANSLSQLYQKIIQLKGDKE